MDNETSFLRGGRAAVKRRRRAPWRRWLFVSLGVVLSAAGLVRFLGGSLFAMERFEIAGSERTRTQEIFRVLEPWRGRNLVMLDLAPLAERLRQLPWIERVTLHKRFPDGLSVRIVERKAAALWKNQGALWWLDSQGSPITTYDPRTDSTDYVVVSGDANALADAVGLLEELRTKTPAYFSALSEIDALPDGDFGMMDSIFRRPVRILRRDAARKIDALLKARGLIESRGWEARAIDLRFADRIILEGAYGAGHSL
jgi:cell division protein FtsQ